MHSCFFRDWNCKLQNNFPFRFKDYVLLYQILHSLCSFNDLQILEEYNESHTAMNLVLFDDALDHLTRVASYNAHGPGSRVAGRCRWIRQAEHLQIGSICCRM